jgi:MoxR-like ATPase
MPASTTTRPRVSLKRVGEMLELLDQMDNPPALMVYGPPGIGKTSILKKFAQDRDYDLRVKHLSRMDTTDWSGIPRTGSDVEYTEFLPINLFQDTRKKKIVIFFDELNTALPQVLNAALDVILEKKGDGARAVLPPETIIVAAGNLGEEDGTFVEELSSAVKTRMIQVEFEVADARSEWIEWAKKADLVDDVVDFIDDRPDLHTLLDLDGFKQNQDQVATPRGWERVSDYMKAFDARATAKTAPRAKTKATGSWRDDKDQWSLFCDLVRGTVGARRGDDFIGWLQSRAPRNETTERWQERAAGCVWLTSSTHVLGDIGALRAAFQIAEDGLYAGHDGADDFCRRLFDTIEERRRNNQFTTNEREALDLSKYTRTLRAMKRLSPTLGAWFAEGSG